MLRINQKYMKNLFLIIAITFLFSGCKPREYTYSHYRPVLMQRVDFESSIQMNHNKPSKLPPGGRVYTKDNLIIVTSVGKGFYFIDNTNPSNPKVLSYFDAPGIEDLLIKDQLMYVHQGPDLVCIDYLENEQRFEVVSRFKNLFTTRPPDGHRLEDKYQAAMNSKEMVVIRWEIITEE